MKWLSVLVFALAATLLQPASAVAESPRPRWEANAVCVASHVPQRWGVRAAVKRWNRVPNAPDLWLARSCPADGIHVRFGVEPGAVGGATRTYQRGPMALRQAHVTLDREQVAAFPRGLRSCLRRWLTSHELGHALGLDHHPNTHAGSVMSYQQWWRTCGRPTAFDRGELVDLYR